MARKQTKKNLKEEKKDIVVIKPDIKEEQKKTDVITKAQFWQIVADAANEGNKKNDKSLTTSLKNHFREPYAMHFVQEGNKFIQKTIKASIIYDSVMDKKDLYVLNDVAYNPYNMAPIALPPINYFNNLNSLIINNFFIGYGELALIAQNPIISNICQIRSNEIIGKWIKLISNDDKDRTEQIKQINEWIEHHNIKDLFKQAIHWSFQFGGCMLYAKLRGDETENSKGIVERTMPLMIDKLQISKGDVEYLTFIEPTWYTAINWQSFNPLARDFYKPLKYTILGQVTHTTRLMHFKYKEVPDILKPTYMFNGQPLSQELVPYLMGFEQSRNNINQLIAKYNHFVLKTNTESLLNDTDSLIAFGQNLGTRIAMFNQIASSNNVIAIDKELEDFDNISINLAGISDVMDQNICYVCSIARIPVTKLFQNSLPGLNPTGEFETNSFYDTIREDRSNIVDKHLNYILKLAQLDLFGEIYEDIKYEWEPLEKANELELSQIRLNKANEATQYITNGTLMPLDVAKKIQNDKDSGWDGLEINEAEYKQREEQQAKLQEQQSKPDSKTNKKQDK